MFADANPNLEGLTIPVYEFHCKTCGHEFERLQHVTDPNPPCPNGCAEATIKLISRSNFVLEGGGWAADAYGSGSIAKKPLGGLKK